MGGDGKSLSTKDFYRHIGIVFQSNRLDDHLTVEENLISRGALYGLSKSQVQKRITDLQSYLDVATLKKAEIWKFVRRTKTESRYCPSFTTTTVFTVVR